MKYILLCPHGIKTGGPEAIHQLSDAMIELGQEAYIWYTLNSDFDFLINNYESIKNLGITIPLRANNINEYKKYKVRQIEHLRFSEEYTFIIPETYIEWIRFFINSKIFLWWLSVDNAFKSLANSNLNLNLLRFNQITHCYQSKYAKNLLESLDMKKNMELSDYTVINSYKQDRRDFIIYNGNHKVTFDVEYLLKNRRLREFQIVKIFGMKSDEIENYYSKSFCYIDLGSFPGKDRMPRESALHNCIPIVLNIAGAKDYNLPNELKLDFTNLNNLSNLTDDIVSNYQTWVEKIGKFKDEIMNEKNIFIQNIKKVIDLST